MHLQVKDGGAQAVEMDEGGRLVAFYAGTLSASALWVITGLALLSQDIRIALPFSIAAAGLTVVSNLKSKEVRRFRI